MALRCSAFRAEAAKAVVAVALFARQLTATDDGCAEGQVPQGYSQRYDQVWVYEGHEVAGDIADYGAKFSYDSSDPRYRFPDGYDPRYAGTAPGGHATEIFSHTNGAKVYLASDHVATEDLKYLNCLSIGAFVNMNAPHLHTEDSYPSTEWGPNYPSYGREAFTKYGQNFPAVPSTSFISFPHDLWQDHYDEVQQFINDKIDAGTSVLIYDLEGSKGAAAVAIAYQLHKSSATFFDTYTALQEKRPWVQDLDDFPDWKTALRSING